VRSEKEIGPGMKVGTPLSWWDPASRRVLLIRPGPEELRARWKFLCGVFRQRIPRMAPWWADEFTQILAGAARGPLFDFEVRCRMRQSVTELRRAVREVERG
jgi:hypothetical protein